MLLWARCRNPMGSRVVRIEGLRVASRYRRRQLVVDWMAEYPPSSVFDL